jgi:hypothetical protein
VKLAGFLLLLSGWIIVLAALALLASSARTVFVFAGMGVELVGVVLVTRGHVVLEGEKG